MGNRVQNWTVDFNRMNKNGIFAQNVQCVRSLINSLKTDLLKKQKFLNIDNTNLNFLKVCVIVLLEVILC